MMQSGNPPRFSVGLRIAIAATSILLLAACAIVLPPLINANLLRGRLASSLSASLGRPVKMENVTLRLLPRPGFAFDNLEVAEDRAFGSEPVMRAASVTVAVRLLPLWRGRIEVAKVSLDQASLNVTRNDAGQWNFASLMQHTARLPPQLPTAQQATRAGARFPYFEVANSRINFKRGAEKLPFSFTDAEFSLWLETPQQWRLRFRALPVRTDLNAAYSGELRIEGAVERAVSANQMAVQGRWLRVPLGQATRLIQGEDRGWRGDAELAFTLRGTLRDAQTTANLHVDGLRREDFVPANVMVIDAACKAHADLLERYLADTTCSLPTGAGAISAGAKGLSLTSFSAARAASGVLLLQRVPAAWVLDSLRLVRRRIDPALSASGTFDGAFSYDSQAGVGSTLTGSAQLQNSSLLVPGQSKPLAFPEIEWVAGNQAAMTSKGSGENSKDEKQILRFAQNDKQGQGQKAMAGSRFFGLLKRHGIARTPVQPFAAPDGNSLRMQPFDVNMGGPEPLRVSGVLTPTGYTVNLNGSADLAMAAPLLRSLGFARWAVLRTVSGQTDVALLGQDRWMHASAVQLPRVQGTVSLHDVTTETAWLPGAIHLTRADAAMDGDSIQWKNVSGTWQGARFDGSANKLLACGGVEDCAWRVSAHTASLDLARVQAAFQPSGTERLLSIFSQSGEGGWPLFKIDLSADSVSDGLLLITHAAAGMTASGSQVDITRCSGVMLAGTMECSGHVDVDRGAADLAIGVSRIGMANLASTFHEHWGAGTIEASINLRLRRGSAAGGDFTGILRNATFTNAAPGSLLGEIDSWQMAGTVSGSGITLDRSVMTADGREMRATGSIELNRRLDLITKPAAGAALHITGTLQSPIVQ